MFPFFFRLAAAQEAAAQQAVAQQAGVGAADKMGGANAAAGHGPSSLFILSDQNIIRRYTRFIIEWPYPFKTICYIYNFNGYIPDFARRHVDLI